MSSALTSSAYSFRPINSCRLCTDLPSLSHFKKQVCSVKCCQKSTEINNFVGGALVSVGIGIALLSPLPALAVPSTSATPYAQSQTLQLGLEKGRIRACPSSNPNCISTTSRSASFGAPWKIPQDSPDNVVKRIEGAILKTQKSPKIVSTEETPTGQYLQAEVDGVLGRDVLEFLVKSDVVTYRSMAKKVIYVYPFTTAFGNAKGQEERMEKIVEELGWYVPSFNDVFN